MVVVQDFTFFLFAISYLFIYLFKTLSHLNWLSQKAEEIGCSLHIPTQMNLF